MLKLKILTTRQQLLHALVGTWAGYGPLRIFCMLREVKQFEHRTALTPTACKDLISEGFQITVEKSGHNDETSRCYPDDAYEQAGCALAEADAWRTAPADAYIFGLKELPEDGCDLKHKHIYFGHCYKGQGGWKELLHRFKKGNGTLLDLEFLTDDNNRRVAAFGYMAGFTGSYVALDVWCHRQLSAGTPYPAITPFPNEDELIASLKKRLAAAQEKCGRLPKILVMGALGRCGSGACDLAVKAGLPESSIVRWDMEETKQGGPFATLLDVDVFVNCIYLSKPIPPFLTEAMLENDQRALTVVCDVSCDTTNPHNPLPFANKATTFDKPTFQVTPKVGPELDVIAIDHLPTLLPKESSDMFCDDLLPSIRSLKEIDSSKVWQKAIKLFHDKMAEAGYA